jgi:Na+/H+-dicarboxylate symporter
MNILIKLLMAIFFGVKRHWHILIAILLGLGAGLLFYNNQWGDDPRGVFLLQFFEFIGEVFIRLITMIVIPLVVSSLIVGLSSLKDTRQLGRMGGKVFTLFLTLMVIAAIIGTVLAVIARPGDNMQAHIEDVDNFTKRVSVNSPIGDTALINKNTTDSKAVAESTETGPALATETAALEQNSDQPSGRDILESLDVPVNVDVSAGTLRSLLLEMIPTNPLKALSSNNLLPAIVYTLALGFALVFIGNAGKPMIALFESLFTATMKLTDWVMMMAVPGVFSLTFFTVATSGMDAFVKLMPYVGVVLTGMLIQIVIVFPLMLQLLARVDALNLYRAVSEAILVAFGTASGSATLPITIANCELRAGISNRVASFVLPTGASINKTATTMFEVVAVMFLTQAYGVQLDFTAIALIAVLSIVASIAAASVPSAGLITMSLIIASLGDGFSLEMFAGGIALLWSIDRILDMCRTVTNVISSVTVAAIVAASEGELKRDLLNNPSAWKDMV